MSTTNTKRFPNPLYCLNDNVMTSWRYLISVCAVVFSHRCVAAGWTWSWWVGHVYSLFIPVLFHRFALRRTEAEGTGRKRKQRWFVPSYTQSRWPNLRSVWWPAENQMIKMALTNKSMSCMAGCIEPAFLFKILFNFSPCGKGNSDFQLKWVCPKLEGLFFFLFYIY